jgi:hypothetical protein
MWNAFRQYREIFPGYCLKAHVSMRPGIRGEVHYSFVEKATK